ncbi:MAG: PEP-CTERM sorting domain-containing protein [Pirellulales bacterium]|nr:PEP-CTERM sorting domain-containing protein [Pirellulales bacterium]
MSMYHRILTVLGIAALFLSVGTMAHGAPVPVELDFSSSFSPNQIDFSATADGTVTTMMFGKVSKFFTGDPNPQTDPIKLWGDTVTASFSGNPIRNPVNETGGAETAVINFDGSNLWTPIDISDVNLTLLDGGVILNGDDEVIGYTGNTIEFWIDTITLDAQTTPPDFFFPDNNIKIDVGGRFVRVDFFQGANGQTINPDGSYAIEGTLRGLVNLDIGIDAFGGTLAVSTGIGTQEFETPFTLTGTLAAFNTDSTDADLYFNGIVSGAFVLSGISTTLTFDSFGAQASISLDALGAIDLSMEYNMFDTAHVPEPGTFVLLGLGAIGLVPFVRRRFRKN